MSSGIVQLTKRTDSAKEAEPSLIVFADDWGRHPSSCQHLIRRLKDRYRILWVNTIGTRSAKANAFTLFRGFEKIRNWSRGVKQVSDRMWVLDAPMLPSISGSVSRSVNRAVVTTFIKRAMKRAGIRTPTVITTLPHVSWLLGDVGQRHTIYYCTDDYSQWPEADRDALLAAERDLQSQSDVVLAVSERLMNRNSHVTCRFFPHAVDFEHFASVRSTEPHDQIAVLPQPRIGFFGLIYEKLDFELLSRVATENATASLLMIGPVDYCPDSFSSLPNVHLLGRKSYAELPQWLSGLDVLLMPYVDDEMIRQSSPLKLKECLATGIPTICVNLPEATKSEPHLSVADDSEQFVRLVGEYVQGNDTMERRSARQQFVKNETWDVRSEQFRSILTELQAT